MKKILLLFTAFLLFSCGTRKTSNGIPGKKTLKGTWTVSNIDFYGNEGTYKAFMFDYADSACFKNSDWMFIPNNGSGKFTTAASNSSCEVSTSRIHWTYFDTESNRYIQMKFVDNKNRRTDAANRGYRIKIKSLTETTMVTEVDVTSNGNPFTVAMTFNKTSDNVKL
ncbi:lipocalin family protein [Flavobacteriaceae bacterium]|nr:lipocalin family protein [Flavobacteriaceae bacterium]